MKNKLLKITGLFFIGGVFTINAQSFEQGQKDVNLGVGFGGTYFSGSSNSTSASGATSSTTVIPPLSATLEFGVTDAISVGGYLGYTGENYTYKYGSYQDKRVYSDYIIGVKGAFHFGHFIRAEKIDLYAGMILADVIEKEVFTTTNPLPGYNSSTSSSTRGGFLFLPTVGCRYRFNDNFGLFAEAGYYLALVNVGVNFKF